MTYFIGRFVHPVEGKGWGKGGGMVVISLTLLENMKTWCNIQVMIYPLS